MKESREEFFELSNRLCTVVADFGVRALKTCQEAKTEPLNALQINQIVTHEIECIIEDLKLPRTADLIIRKAELDFWKLGEEKRS